MLCRFCQQALSRYFSPLGRCEEWAKARGFRTGQNGDCRRVCARPWRYRAAALGQSSRTTGSSSALSRESASWRSPRARPLVENSRPRRSFPNLCPPPCRSARQGSVARRSRGGGRRALTEPPEPIRQGRLLDMKSTCSHQIGQRGPTRDRPPAWIRADSRVNRRHAIARRAR